MYDSGKKKRHTLKNVLLVDSFGSIHFLSDTYEGRVHDKCIADEARYTLPAGSILDQDAGFQGFRLPGVQIMPPKKKPRNGTITLQEKEENRRISSVRVRIDHGIGDIKRYRDYSRRYPLQLFRISGYGHGTMVRAAYLPSLAETQKAFQKSKQILMKSDVKTQSITSGYLFGISFAVDFAWRTWNGDDPKQAIRGAIRSGIDAGNQALIIGVLSAQALRTPVAAAGAVVLRGGVRSVAATDLGRDLVQCIAAGSLGKAVYGAAAVNHVAKLLRSNAITSVVSLAVVTAPDVYRAAIAGDISWSQVAKNMAINGAGIAAGAGGWFAGVAAGAAIGSAVPIIGTAIGGVIGGICGGMMGGAAGVGGARMVLDPFIQDDSDRMIALLQDAIGALASDYLLSEHEVAELMTEVRRTVSDSWLRDMYQKGSSGGSDVDRRQFAYDSFEEACRRIVRRRSKVCLPDPDQVLSAVSDALTPDSLLLPDRESC